MRQCLLATAFLVVAALSSGCASRSLTENQCTAGDWQTVGVRDGRLGYPRTRLLTHQDACGRYGVVPDRERYLAGWREGVAEFCRADNGYELGASGIAHNDVCPTEYRDDFLNAYTRGRTLYLARSDVQHLRSTLEHNRQRLEFIDARVLEIAAAQVLPDLTPEQRVASFNESKSLLEERKRIEHDTPILEDELAAAVQRLDEVERRG